MVSHLSHCSVFRGNCLAWSLPILAGWGVYNYSVSKTSCYSFFHFNHNRCTNAIFFPQLYPTINAFHVTLSSLSSKFDNPGFLPKLLWYFKCHDLITLPCSTDEVYSFHKRVLAWHGNEYRIFHISNKYLLSFLNTNFTIFHRIKQCNDPFNMPKMWIWVGKMLKYVRYEVWYSKGT